MQTSKNSQSELRLLKEKKRGDRLSYFAFDYFVYDEAYDCQSNQDNQHQDDDEFDGSLLVFLCLFQLLHSIAHLGAHLLNIVVDSVQYRALWGWYRREVNTKTTPSCTWICGMGKDGKIKVIIL